MSKIIATFFYVGYLKPAPGTWGSLAALVVGMGLAHFYGLGALLIGVVASFALGLWAATVETREGPADPSEIVIDEVAGMWIAMLPLVFFTGGYLDALGLGLGFAAFLAFRLFDIWKPWPVRWADQLHTPFGLMFDDVLAGFMVWVIYLPFLYILLAFGTWGAV